MGTLKAPECHHLHGYSKRVRALQHTCVESLWKEAAAILVNDHWQDGTDEADAKAIRRVAKNIAKGQWKAARRNMLSMDTSPRDLIGFVWHLLHMVS